jgi:starch phosphorylase
MPEFEGKILFVEGYGLHLSRRLVQGVDVWLNNPVYPMEASGTSGMKAAFNGVVNLSVLDGWWAEGYQGDNGWAIKPGSPLLDEERRNREESRSLYELLEDRVLPLYYDDRKGLGHSPEWIKLAKRSMVSLLPRFNSVRMLEEYVNKFYRPAAQQGRIYAENGWNAARTISAWKERVRQAWSGVSLRRIDSAAVSVSFSEQLRIEVAAKLNGLGPDDVVVELLLSRRSGEPDKESAAARYVFTADAEAAGERRYVLQLAPELCGKLEYRIRAYPYHPLLTHRFELGLLTWV